MLRTLRSASALCPGPVETGFFDVIGTRKAAIGGRIAAPHQVVARALRALSKNSGYTVPGVSNFVSTHLQPRRPRKMLARISRTVTRGVLTP
jgi:short-subunit dehydrogenase